MPGGGDFLTNKVAFELDEFFKRQKIEDTKKEEQRKQKADKLARDTIKTLAERRAEARSVTGYVIEMGRDIRIPTQRVSSLGRMQTCYARDFEMMMSQKRVVYAPEDVILNPMTEQCVEQWGLPSSIFRREKNYYGFALPKNSKGVPFILVPVHNVDVLYESMPSDFKDDFKDWLDEVMKAKFNDPQFLLNKDLGK
jgi:hypothetical protein